MRLLATLLVLFTSSPAFSTSLASSEPVCEDGTLPVHLGIELQSDFWYYIPHPNYEPRTFCVRLLEHQAFTLEQPQPMGNYFSKIHFTLYPEEPRGTYFVAAYREDSYDSVRFEKTETACGLTSSDAALTVELGGWYHYQRQNFRVTFEVVPHFW